MLELTDGVVRLRRMTLDDAARHLAGEDEAMARYLSGGRSTIETVSAWIERSADSWKIGGSRRMFGVADAATGELIGMIEVNLAPAGLRAGVANVSYGIYPEARGRGYAARAVRLMLRYLEEATAADTALIQVIPENQASSTVPLKAGFRLVGRRMTEENCPLMFICRIRPTAGRS